jgi:hypothetical protein
MIVDHPRLRELQVELLVTPVTENRKLPDGVELVKEDTFWPEGRWSFRRGDLVWSRVAGWQKFYEVKREARQVSSGEEPTLIRL